MLKIWFVDDMENNRQSWLRSFPQQIHSFHELKTFDTVEKLFSDFEKGQYPDILFIDYYIGHRRGHEVVDYFQNKSDRPLLIAHSSMLDANKVMLSRGADLYFEKKPGSHQTHSIIEQIQSEEDLFSLLEYYKSKP